MERKPVIAIIVGSERDLPYAKRACDVLDRLNIPYEVKVLSAHRQHQELEKYVLESDVKLFIAMAGLSAALPGFIASLTNKPVIGVPLPVSLMGLDALLSMVQMPKGVPVAVVGIDNPENAAYLAHRILKLIEEEIERREAEMPIIPSTMESDIHGLEYMHEADLVIFMAGNQFMVMPELIKTFQKEYPEVKKIFYETLPSGLMLKQILAKGALLGSRVITGKPDIYTCTSIDTINTLRSKGLIDEYFTYLHNRIVLMLPQGNPAKINSIHDLARDDVRISQPDPEIEDIGKHTMQMYRDAGGDELVHKIMEVKRIEGTTIMTRIHHRETPVRLMKRTVDVGPVWYTEYVHARNQGYKFEVVEPGENYDQRDKVNYYAVKLKNCPNPENAQKFLDFLKSRKAKEIFRKYGFSPHEE